MHMYVIPARIFLQHGELTDFYPNPQAGKPAPKISINAERETKQRDECYGCAANSTQEGVVLKRCSGCKLLWYCSRCVTTRTMSLIIHSHISAFQQVPTARLARTQEALRCGPGQIRPRARSARDARRIYRVPRGRARLCAQPCSLEASMVPQQARFVFRRLPRTCSLSV